MVRLFEIKIYLKMKGRKELRPDRKPRSMLINNSIAKLIELQWKFLTEYIAVYNPSPRQYWINWISPLCFILKVFFKFKLMTWPFKIWISDWPIILKLFQSTTCFRLFWCRRRRRWNNFFNRDSRKLFYVPLIANPSSQWITTIFGQIIKRHHPIHIQTFWPSSWQLFFYYNSCSLFLYLP